MSKKKFKLIKEEDIISSRVKEIFDDKVENSLAVETSRRLEPNCTSTFLSKTN